jgi:hypothetical protein
LIERRCCDIALLLSNGRLNLINAKNSVTLIPELSDVGEEKASQKYIIDLEVQFATPLEASMPPAPKAVKSSF